MSSSSVEERIFKVSETDQPAQADAGEPVRLHPGAGRGFGGGAGQFRPPLFHPQGQRRGHEGGHVPRQPAAKHPEQTGRTASRSSCAGRLSRLPAARRNADHRQRHAPAGHRRYFRRPGKTEKSLPGKRLFRSRTEKETAAAARPHRRGHVADRGGRARHRAHPAPPLSRASRSSSTRPRSRAKAPPPRSPRGIDYFNDAGRQKRWTS